MKGFCVNVLAVCFILVAASVSHAAITDGLVSYWPLDGSLQDDLNVNNGTLVGTNTTPSYGAGKFGDGIDLDGVDQFVDVGNGPSLDMDVNGAGAQTGSVSISAWFRVDSFDKEWQTMISKGEGQAYRIARRAATSEIGYAGGSGEGPASGLNVADRAIHHVAAVSINGVETQLWIDGVLDTLGAAPTIINDGNAGAPNPVNPPLWIGANPQTGATTPRSWNGLLDDVAIWSRPLTPGEIGAIYNGGAGRSIGSIPEPGSILLFGCGAGLMFLARRRRR